MLIGKKIILRPLNSSDLSFLRHIENNSENWIFGSENKIFSELEYLKISVEKTAGPKEKRSWEKILK